MNGRMECVSDVLDCCVVLNIFISNILYNIETPQLHLLRSEFTMRMNQLPHGLACDGCGIAKDDLHELENMQKREEAEHELFQNAARIHKVMRTNRWLCPIFRKYKCACREILHKKKEEADQILSLCDYCDNPQHNQHQKNHDLKCIQHEISKIHDEIKNLEELQWTDSGSDSESESESESDSGSDQPDFDDDSDNESCCSSSSSSSCSSSSSSSSSSSCSSLLDMASF